MNHAIDFQVSLLLQKLFFLLLYKDLLHIFSTYLWDNPEKSSQQKCRFALHCSNRVIILPIHSFRCSKILEGGKLHWLQLRHLDNCIQYFQIHKTHRCIGTVGK